ncbi:hypothetical protein [Bradyrhizobium sp. URHC0002]
MQMDDYPQQAPSYSWQESTGLWRTSHEEIARRNIGCCQGQARHHAVAASGPDASNNVWNRAMTPRTMNRVAPIIRLLLTAALLAPHLAYAAADQDRVQFCWAMGKHDHTIYFAEIENREDRQASFDELLEISGIDHHAVKCNTSDLATHHPARAALFKNWRESEFEIVNTTFLSDLDY